MPGTGGGAPAEAAPGTDRAPAPQPAEAVGEEAEAAAELTPEERHREGAVPEDNAHYACPTCGCAFEARVSTSVHCPHCGDTQAW
jgi:rubrerythrin